MVFKIHFLHFENSCIEILHYYIVSMVSADDLTLDEIKAQLALYQTLYVRKRK